MPLPIWLIGLAAGGLAHLSAQDKNDTAERLNIEAQDLYDYTKSDFDKAVSEAKSSIREIQLEKQNVLDKSIKLFLCAYDRIKTIHFNETGGIRELDKFQVMPTDMPHLQELTDIYDSATVSGVAGAAVGATALAVGSAETLAALGASVTPLAAIAAPVVVFTAISANITADENLSKAKATYAKAEAAAEKMKTEIVKCNAIKERTDMYSTLLKQLDERFLYCALLLYDMVESKSQGGKVQLDASSFTRDEQKLIAVTRALAGAVKSVLDVPILGSDGKPTYESANKANEIKNVLPEFHKQVSNVENSSVGISQEEFKRKLEKIRRIEEEKRRRETEKQKREARKRHIIKTGVVAIGSLILPVSPILKCLIFCIAYSFIESPNIFMVTDGVAWVLTLVTYASDVADSSHFLLKTIGSIIGIIVVFIIALTKESKVEKYIDEWSDKCTINAIYAVAFQLGIIVYALVKWLFSSGGAAIGITVVLYLIMVLLVNMVLNEGKAADDKEMIKTKLKAAGMALLVLIVGVIVCNIFPVPDFDFGTTSKKSSKETTDRFENMYELYNDVLVEYKDKTSKDFMFREYLIGDLNRDGIPELIIHIGNDLSNAEYDVFTYDDGELIGCGALNGSIQVNNDDEAAIKRISKEAITAFSIDSDSAYISFCYNGYQHTSHIVMTKDYQLEIDDYYDSGSELLEEYDIPGKTLKECDISSTDLLDSIKD